MWQAPNRPNQEISQTYNDGIVTICSVENIAKPGYQPVIGLQNKVVLRYQEQRLGINRLYLSRQNQVELEKVLRIPYWEGISSQDVAVLTDGRQYRIDTIQTVSGVYPPSLDISLSKIEQNYKIAQKDGVKQ